MPTPPDVPPPGRTPEPGSLRRSVRAEGGLGGLRYRAGVELRELVPAGSPGGRDPAPAALGRRKPASTPSEDEERADGRALRRWESEGGAVAG